MHPEPVSTSAVLRSFQFVSLSTGQDGMEPRELVPDSIVAALRPVIEAGGGPVPGIPEWFLHFWSPSAEDERNCGYAIFQIADRPGQSANPAAMTVACWEEAMSAQLWTTVAHLYEPLNAFRALGLWKRMPLAAPRTPWLAAWLCPLVLQMDVAKARWLVPIQVGVAWTLTEM